jgi:hypothetical protein
VIEFGTGDASSGFDHYPSFQFLPKQLIFLPTNRAVADRAAPSVSARYYFEFREGVPGGGLDLRPFARCEAEKIGPRKSNLKLNRVFGATGQMVPRRG